MNNQFISKQNLDSLYNFVNSNIRQETNIDLNTDRKYRVAIEKLAHNFHGKNPNTNIYYLNNMVLDKVKPIILKNLHKNITSVLNLVNSNPNPQTNLTGAPLVNRDSTVDTLNNINQLSRNRDDNKKILQDLQKLESDRDYSNLVSSSTSFENKVEMAKKISENKLDEVNQSRVDENNDFFKNLYENKITSNPPDFLQTPANSKQNIVSLPPRNMPNGPPIVNDPPTIDYRSDKPEFDLSNLQVDDSISGMLKDQSKADKVEFKEPTQDFPEIKESRENNKIEEISKNALDNFYQNDSYVFERRKKKMLIIDVSNYLSDVRDSTSAVVNNSSGVYWRNFTVNLIEEFKIDKLADVYLESITVNNPALATNFENLYMVIDIAEINIQTNTNNTFMKDKFIIPNENTSTAGGNKIMKYHLKSNYIATVNPGTLDRLTFKITNENNHSTAGIVSTGVLINEAAGYASGRTGALTVDGSNATEKISVGDILFNQQGQRLGEVTTVASDTSITIVGGLEEDLFENDVLYISSRASGVFINLSAGYAVNTTTKINTDTVNADIDFNVGDLVYLSDNSRLGTITAVASDGITFGGGTFKSIKDNVQLYTAPPNAVFASNSPFNRLVMEIVFITR